MSRARGGRGIELLVSKDCVDYFLAIRDVKEKVCCSKDSINETAKSIVWGYLPCDAEQ